MLSETRSLAYRWGLAAAGGVLACFSSAPAQEVDCDAFPFNVAIHAESIAVSPHQSPSLLLQSDQVPVARGSRTRFYVSIVSQLETKDPLAGVQGFVLGFNVTGNVTLSGVSFEGTSSAYAPDGLSRQGTLSYAMVTDPILAGAGDESTGQGVVVAHIYALMERVTMLPTGTATVLAVDVSGPAGEDPAGVIEFRDGFSGNRPVQNQLSVNSVTRSFGPEDQPLACARGTTFVPVSGPTFIRGDADGNGTIELTDGIHIHRYLFLGQPRQLACQDAADLNDSGDLDLTDGIIVFRYLFIGGRQPAAPFPGCGIDRGDADRLTCGSFDFCRG